MKPWMQVAFALLVVACDDGEGSDGETADLSWYANCGDPVCSTYRGPFDGVPVCASETAGDPCSDDGAQCDLENDCNQFLVCAESDPQDQTGGCPISKQDAKRDIAYLGADQREQLRKDAVAMKLATWRYRHEADDARPHLGFVIDDQPTSPAVRTDGERVDLYGYTSLVLAALQAQEAELTALKAEVKTLREQVDTCR